MINSLIEALNLSAKLPRYVIIVLDADLIKSALPCDFGIKVKLSKIANYLMSEINKLMETRRENLKTVRAGA